MELSLFSNLILNKIIKTRAAFLFLISAVLSLPSIGGPAGKFSDTLTIVVKNIKDYKGFIRLNIVESKEHEKHSYRKYFRHNSTLVVDSTIKIKIPDLPPGKYVVAVWHDKNNNEKMDLYLPGMPSENYGYSNNVRGRYGPPSHEKSQFQYNGKDTSVTILLGDYYYNPLNQDSLAYKNSWIFAPFAGYVPETKVFFGINAARLFKFKGADSTSRTSLADVFAIYTVNKQIIVEQSYTIFTNKDKWLGQGYSKFQRFPQYYFGVGNNLPASGKELISYDEVKMEHVWLRKIRRGIFFGAGFRYTNIYKMAQPSDGILFTSQTPGYLGSRASGITLAFSSDNRDNIYNSFKGHLIKIRYNIHNHIFGSQYKFNTWELDLRKFMKVSKSGNNILALQLYSLLANGNTPWNEMGALGNDIIMRGYYPGRYRDNNYLAFQGEYRLYLTRSFGLVSFLGFGSVAPNIRAFNFQSFKPSYGCGIRFRIDHKEKFNLRFDYGIGRHTSNFYITVAESF